MKKIIYISLLFSTFLLIRCKTAPKELEEKEILNPKSIVEVVNVKSGTVDDELVLSATTVYLKRNVVTATIPAFITNVKVKLGDAVNKGDVLYELESKERRALGNNTSKLDTSLVNFGLIKIRASTSGIISTLDKQQPGDYVLEGTQLCTIAESSDLAFQVNVPYEFTSYTKPGKTCVIQLPDSTKHQAEFTKALTAMNVLAQTQTILAKVKENLFLPENMIVKVSIVKGSASNKQLLPKTCILSDEMMKEFWVMKLINDTTAIKIPVVIGNKNAVSSEVISPQFNLNDKIISSGNYGLPDTALVKISAGK
ncbi:MAG TPA: HlyD family efflux transporter periplasmic adaptor subunit [Bacteroidia bacterium]|nr:HlyD family efflux transporter periplasmic adaptor subunit [Bacteroidia bacterium]